MKAKQREMFLGNHIPKYLIGTILIPDFPDSGGAFKTDLIV